MGPLLEWTDAVVVAVSTVLLLADLDPLILRQLEAYALFAAWPCLATHSR